MAAKSSLIEYGPDMLLQGDCLEHMRAMKKQGLKVDLVMCSPPYEKARLYLEDGKDLGIARNTEDWVAWMVEVVEASLAVCSGLCAFVVGHGSRARRWSGAPALLAADLIRKGVCLRRPAWYKRNGIMGSGGNDWLRADLEFIICATNGPEKLPWSDNTACGHPPKYKPGGTPSHRTINGERVNEEKRVTEKNPGGERGKNGEIQKYKQPDIANPGDIIDCGCVGGSHMSSNISHDNEAPFPEQLPDFFIRSFCKPDGLVFDPFSGSGTTLAAAIKTGRHYLGIDLRPSQIELCKRRVRQARLNKGFGL